MANDVGATASRQPATHEPSLASRLGPSGECQAQLEPTELLRSTHYRPTIPLFPQVIGGQDIVHALEARMRGLEASQQQVAVHWSILREARDEIERLRAIADCAHDFISRGTRLTRPAGIAQVVIESADKSDPHYRLCSALEGYAPASVDTLPKGGDA